MKRKSTNNFLLALTAFIWGSAFVAQSVGMDYLGPFTFNSIRCLMGGIVLIPVLLLFKRNGRKKSQEQVAEVAGAGIGSRKDLIVGGICCGLALAAGSSLQQIGLVYTTAGKAGFITALYIVIVPVMGILLGKRVGLKVWIGVVLAATGMYFLCITEGFSIAKGDFFVFLCAAAFSVHILVIDSFAPKVDGVALSCIQFFVCGILCAVPMLVSEQPQISQIMEAWVPLAYAGVLSCGVAYTLQVVAQKNTDPAVASLILSLESVFSVLAGWVILGERLSGRELFGCALVFTAVILAQFPEKAR
ncbi:MAG TPA: DMT family transporter [Candidatus Mediterraneibacter pullicola]|uniref:DMT family transporter n=1 Tax=Candidatus Mediterraneibacter pullicola TaxID=2838682 RepID=A0A9D2KKB1_9FIRM|nr:DMT family transporter [Candidatus Mediterraneibacter pullicola]